MAEGTLNDPKPTLVAKVDASSGVRVCGVTVAAKATIDGKASSWIQCSPASSDLTAYNTAAGQVGW